MVRSEFAEFQSAGKFAKQGEKMANKKMIAGILATALVFMAAGTVSAQTVVADLGDVRIYYYGAGYFGVESDRAGQCLPLNFRRSGRAGWIEVACSSEVATFASNQLGDAVSSVVKKAFAAYLSPAGSYVAGEMAAKVASWAARQGIDYLCGN
jgi:hypothetical protein